LDEDLKALKIVMNVLICNSLMVCKRMIDEAFIPVTGGNEYLLENSKTLWQFPRQML
jgi:hypothetical protein